MHIQDGVLSPAVCVATGAVSVAAVGYSLHKLKASIAERIVPLTGMMAALVFAGQMVNFPLGVVPVSGHLIGGVLAAVVLGPWGGCLALTLVLVVQRFLFSDGGLLTLGTNVLHMAVIGSIGGHAVYSFVSRLAGGGRRACLIGVATASWLSVMAAAALFCLEFRLSHAAPDFDFGRIFLLMVSFHALIGVGEALISVAVINFIWQQRPDLIESPSVATGPIAGLGRVLTAGMVAALAIGAFLAPFASSLPDGLDSVAGRFGFNGDAVSSWTAFDDYDAIPLGDWSGLSVSVAGIVGTLLVFLAAVAIGRAFRQRSSLAEANRE